MKLRHDDLELGMYVTVVQGPTCYRHTNGGALGDTLVSESYMDESYMGDVLVIEAINLPFVAVRLVRDEIVVPLDLRVYGLSRLSQEYVAAITRQESDE